jgi:adenosylcobinamide-GDP ribazoletransferase
MRWFPLVGALIGGAVGLVWWAAAKAWPAAVAAAIAVLADAVCTGMLHLDGLADSADGLLPHLPRQQRLEVMAEPGVGAFGVSVVVIALLLRFAAFDALAPHVALVAGVWCASRAVMAGAAGSMPYVRPGGLASAFLPDRPAELAAVGVGGVVAGAALAGWGRGWGGVVAVAGLVVVAAAVLLLARRRLGGFTGDVLGAAGVLGETVALVIAAARW